MSQRGSGRSSSLSSPKRHGSHGISGITNSTLQCLAVEETKKSALNSFDSFNHVSAERQSGASVPETQIVHKNSRGGDMKH